MSVVLTNALQQRAVVNISTGAVAAVSRDVVDTHSILTNLWLETLTLIHIWGTQRKTNIWASKYGRNKHKLIHIRIYTNTYAGNAPKHKNIRCTHL